MSRIFIPHEEEPIEEPIDEPYPGWIRVLVFLAMIAFGGAFWMAVAAYFSGEL